MSQNGDVTLEVKVLKDTESISPCVLLH